MKTINLKAYRATVQPGAPGAIFVAVILLLVALNAAATWPSAPQAPAVPTPALRLPIVVIQKEPEYHTMVRERIVYVVATPTAQAAPAVAEQPQAAEATPYTADARIVQQDGASVSTIEVPTDAPRLCTGFGDWRDYDQHYASSPACKP
jgi:hypothetical protein